MPVPIGDVPFVRSILSLGAIDRAWTSFASANALAKASASEEAPLARVRLADGGDLPLPSDEALLRVFNRLLATATADLVIHKPSFDSFLTALVHSLDYAVAPTTLSCGGGSVSGSAGELMLVLVLLNES